MPKNANPSEIWPSVRSFAKTSNPFAEICTKSAPHHDRPKKRFSTIKFIQNHTETMQLEFYIFGVTSPVPKKCEPFRSFGQQCPKARTLSELSAKVRTLSSFGAGVPKNANPSEIWPSVRSFAKTSNPFAEICTKSAPHHDRPKKRFSTIKFIQNHTETMQLEFYIFGVTSPVPKKCEPFRSFGQQCPKARTLSELSAKVRTLSSFGAGVPKSANPWLGPATHACL